MIKVEPLSKYCFGILLFLLSGCCHNNMTPNTLQRDAMNYNDALHYTGNSQLLLNIVRLHYKENATFLQVGVISAAYENKNAFGLDGEFQWLRPIAGSYAQLAPKIAIERSEKPTTTFQQVRGEDYVTQFLSPISLRSLALLNGSGWELERLLRCSLQRINHLYNSPNNFEVDESTGQVSFPFLEFCRDIDVIDRQGAVHLAYHKNSETGESDLYLTFNSDLADREFLGRVKRRLGLDPDLNSFRIVNCQGSKSCLENELSMELHSPLSMFHYLSHGVETPFIDKQMRLVSSTFRDPIKEHNWRVYFKDFFSVKCSTILPPIFPSSIAYYRRNIFYIDESDLQTKSTFVLLSQILSLQVSVPNLPPPILTLPLN